MEKYIVGGAVRDFLLAKLQGRLNTPEEVQIYWSQVEKDWVVVGSTPENMIGLGFKRVGKSFPVFLDPLSHEEYALARTERKIGHGYTGFEFYASSEVSLVEDLKRRDLTINAIAAPEPLDAINFETVIDPYGGVEDLKKKLFRHVSPAFAEDPVRILRLARLAARFGDFSVDPSTIQLTKQMVASGEIDTLVPERVWQEWDRSLKEESPWRFFEVLQQCGALATLFPAIKEPASKHKQLQQAVATGADEAIILTIQLYDVGLDVLPSLLSQYRIPTHLAEFVRLVASQLQHYLTLDVDDAPTLLSFYQQTDAFRRTDRFYLFLKTCMLITGNVTSDIHHRLETILLQLLNIEPTQFIKAGYKGAQIAEELQRVRLATIEKCLKQCDK